MAEKKNASKKESTAKKTSKQAKTSAKKEVKKVASKKSTTKAPKKEVKKEIKQEKPVDTFEEKLKENKKKNKIVKWFNNLTLEQIVIGGFIITAILLIILIGVATKNTKTSKGKDIVVQVKGKTITADDLYKELKDQYGESVAINLIDEYILDKEYKTTDDMKKTAEATINSYKSTYGDSYQSFLEYNGIKNDKALKDLLIRNSKLSKVTDDYIKETLTKKEMKDYYESSIVGDISAKHILIAIDAKEDATDDEKTKLEEDARKKAEEVLKKIKAGEDFKELAKKYSDDEGTKNNGGDLGYFNKGDMVQEFEDAAYKLNVNEYTTEPVKTDYGYHIIMKTGEKDKPSYKKAKTTIKEKLVAKKKEEDETISEKAIIALRKKYNIKIKDKKVKSDYNTYKKDAVTTTKSSN